MTRPPPCVCGHSHSIHATHNPDEPKCVAFTADTPCECKRYEPQLVTLIPPRHAMSTWAGIMSRVHAQDYSPHVVEGEIPPHLRISEVVCDRCGLDLTGMLAEGKVGHACGNPEHPPSVSPAIEEAYREMRETAEMLDDAIRDGSYGDRMRAAKAMVADATWLVQKLREDK